MFPGRFGLETAEAVCAGPGLESGAVFDCLTGLVDKSLVLAEAGRPGAVRYRLLDSLRQYAWQRLLDSGEARATQQRNALYHVELAEYLARGVAKPEAVAWLERLEMEQENLRAALRWALDSGEDALAPQLRAALWRFWWVRGQPQAAGPVTAVGWPWGRDLAAGDRSRALSAAGGLVWSQAASARVAAVCVESLALSRAAGDQWGMAIAQGLLGVVAHVHGDDERAIDLCTESLTRCRELADPWGTALTLGMLGLIRQRAGDAHEGTALWNEGLAILQDVGDHVGLALLIEAAGNTAFALNDTERTIPRYTKALALYQACDDEYGIARCQEALAAEAAVSGVRVSVAHKPIVSRVATAPYGSEATALEGVGGSTYGLP